MIIFKEIIKKRTLAFLLFRSDVAAASFKLAYGQVPCCMIYWQINSKHLVVSTPKIVFLDNI